MLLLLPTRPATLPCFFGQPRQPAAQLGPASDNPSDLRTLRPALFARPLGTARPRTVHTACTGQRQGVSTKGMSHEGTSTADNTSEKDQRITFANPQGLTIVGTLRDTGSKDVVILCHGLGDHKDGFCLPELAGALCALGVSSLRFDFPGNGESQGTFRYANMRDEAEDIRAGRQYLQSLGKDVSGLVGHSKAGSGVILYAAKYDDIPRVVNISGRFDNLRGIKERFGEDIHERLDQEGQVQIVWPNSSNPDIDSSFTWMLTKEDMHDRVTLDMDPHSRAIARSHVLVIHGDADATIPVEDAFSFHSRIKGSELVVVEGADHNYKRRGKTFILIDHVVHFLLHGTVLLAQREDEGVKRFPQSSGTL